MSKEPALMWFSNLRYLLAVLRKALALAGRLTSAFMKEGATNMSALDWGRPESVSLQDAVLSVPRDGRCGNDPYMHEGRTGSKRVR
jgi:hypothetical protein